MGKTSCFIIYDANRDPLHVPYNSWQITNKAPIKSAKEDTAGGELRSDLIQRAGPRNPRKRQKGGILGVALRRGK